MTVARGKGSGVARPARNVSRLKRSLVACQTPHAKIAQQNAPPTEKMTSLIGTQSRLYLSVNSSVRNGSMASTTSGVSPAWICMRVDITSSPLPPGRPPSVAQQNQGSQCAEVMTRPMNKVDRMALRELLEVTENHSPRLAAAAAYVSHANTSKGNIKKFMAPVMAPKLQMTSSHRANQRTLKTLPSHLPNRISSLLIGLVRIASNVSFSRSPRTDVAARTATPITPSMPTSMPTLRTQLLSAW